MELSMKVPLQTISQMDKEDGFSKMVTSLMVNMSRKKKKVMKKRKLLKKKVKKELHPNQSSIWCGILLLTLLILLIK
jgi:hypothetical protein